MRTKALAWCIPIVLVAADGVAATSERRATSSGEMRITKIHFNPKGRDTGTNRHVNKEYIVLFNAGDRAVSLARWKLHDRGRDNVYRFGRRAPTLEPTEEFYLYSGRGRDGGVTGCNGDCHTTYTFFWDRDDYVWDNRTDTATLRNAVGTIVDRCRYTRAARRQTDCGG